MAINIAGIKTAFKSVMDTANNSGAAYDLSTGMSKRVQKVFMVNPAKIAIQASLYPFVTIALEEKPIEQATMAKDQTNAKRRSDLEFGVWAAVWENTLTDVTKDDAQEEIEKLMENVEEVIRRNYKLNNTVGWSMPQRVQYFTVPVDEEAFLRVGFMPLICRVDY